MKPTPAERDAYIAEKILTYCGEIEETMTRFGMEKSVFLSDSVYRNAVSLCVLQIGELSVHLTQEFRTEHSEIPWRKIRDMRNIVAHRYGALEPEQIWDVVTMDIPVLQECLKLRRWRDSEA